MPIFAICGRNRRLGFQEACGGVGAASRCRENELPCGFQVISLVKSFIIQFAAEIDRLLKA